MKGKLITLEGPEGSGKSTQAKRLALRLRRLGLGVLVTREPGGTPVGEAIRGVLQHDKAGESITPEAEALLFVACRAQLVRTVILPALDKGRWVVCDRFGDSTTAYQGYGRKLGAAAMQRLNDFAMGGAVPDATILLDMDAGRAFERLGKRNAATRSSHDRIERESLRFHRTVLAGYRELARKNPRRFIVVDADQDQDAVEAAVWEKLRAKLGLRKTRGLTRPSEYLLRESTMLEQAIENFRRGVAAGRVAQGYVVVGPPREEAGAFADKALPLIFCQDGKKPCGVCRNCRTIQEHTHPDVLWMEPEKKSRAISVEQIRDLQQRVYQTSFGGSWKACVMVAADRMGASAANAFLKTLEEPPPKSVFFLLTDSPQSLLPTIASRCQRVVVSGGEIRLPEEWRAPLVAILADSSGSGSVAAFARADRMEKILKDIKEKVRSEETELAGDSDLDVEDKTLDARINARYREIRTGVMQYLLRWYRDMLMIVCGVDEACVHNQDSLDLLRRKAREVTYRQALRNVELIETMNRQFEENITELPVLGLAFCRLT